MAAELVLCLSSQVATATLAPLPITTTTQRTTSTSFLAATNKSPPSRLTCAVSTHNSQLTTSSDNNTRRSANYQPNLWNFEFLHSLDNQLEVKSVEERVRELEEKVRGAMKKALDDDDDPLTLLEFIDNVQRLGLAYKFDSDITAALIQSSRIIDYHQLGLHATALSFRLLRQHGLPVSQDVFKSCIEEDKDDDDGKKNKLKAEIRSDVQGLLSLYEASFLSLEGEDLLEEARALAAAHLEEELLEEKEPKLVVEKVKHALEMPYHRRVQRIEARWFIERYQGDDELVELAKLDFNMVQAKMKRELHELSRWWREIGLTSKLEFVRDRLMEVYFWAIGMAPDPDSELSACRKAVTKMFGLVTIIDDVYDVYGTLEELQLFTDAVERWDVDAVDTLPDYMKLCFLALYNTVNDIAYSTIRDKGDNTLPYLAKSWRDLCKAFLQEAKWSNNKIIPAFDEYLKNASVSSSGGALLAPCYFSVTQDVSSEAVHSLTNLYDDDCLVRSSCVIFRLCNDLATSAAELERGETTNSITSFMNQNGTSEEEARDSLRKLIDKEWNKMNKVRATATATATATDTLFPKAFKDIAINMAKVSHCTYHHGDGLGRPDDTAENRIKLLLVDPIPIN